MYILTDEPHGGARAVAFEALDNAFGTEEFTHGQAITVLSNLVENSEATLRDLENSGSITEVE